MIQVIQYPHRNQWRDIMRRPAIDNTELDGVVTNILREVRNNGDRALLEYTHRLDGVALPSLVTSEEEINSATIDDKLKAAIELAHANITAFHKSQLITEPVVETLAGVKCWRKSIAIESVGLYIPGGSAPLFSTVLMLGIPAKLAGCDNIILCTPPNKDGTIDSTILFTCRLIGIHQIFKVGGAQAIAAMAYGTSSIPCVDKIFGPGNQYVTRAKELVQQSGIAIDMPAGPSELLVIADNTCIPEFVAADLLSQAEHGQDSQVILLTNSAAVVTHVQEEIQKQIQHLPRKQTAAQALIHSAIVLLPSLEECMEFSNQYAPEHLILVTDMNSSLVSKIRNAGSVFLGKYSCESVGDYASGPNHTLPTQGHAKSHSGAEPFAAFGKNGGNDKR